VKPPYFIKPLIKSLYRTELNNEKGVISSIKRKNLTYLVTIESHEKQLWLAEIHRKPIDDYFDAGFDLAQREKAKQEILKALKNTTLQE
jgi:hypothetical protein